MVLCETATFSEAIRALFSITAIRRLLTLESLNVVIDEQIDDVTKIEGRSCRDTINDLLNVSGAIMSVNDAMVTIGPRSSARQSRRIVYGDSDRLRRKPTIFNIKDHNTGMHRLFNSVSINGHRVVDENSIAVYGLREREDFEYEFLTTIDKIDRVAKNILQEFRYPREEMKILVLTEQITGLKLSDNIALNFRPLARPSQDSRMPLYGSACLLYTSPSPRDS